MLSYLASSMVVKVSLTLPSEKIKVSFAFKWTSNINSSKISEANGDGDFIITLAQDILDYVKFGMFLMHTLEDQKEYIQQQIKEKYGLTALKKDIFVEMTSYSYVTE